MRFFWIFLVLAAIGLGGWFGWNHVQTVELTKNATSEVAPLIEYRELYSSGSDREGNDVLLKTVATLIDAQNEGVDIQKVLQQAEILNNTPVNYSDLLTESLLRNLKIARELELDTENNLILMKEGKSPFVGLGPYAGERAEVDHIVPRSLAPDLDNLLINLELMPRTLNRKKGNKVTKRVEEVAKKFFEAGVMQPESFETVQKSRKVVSPAAE